jgi:cobalt-zinc-cadmium efflux system outer membrane protein
MPRRSRSNQLGHTAVAAVVAVAVWAQAVPAQATPAPPLAPPAASVADALTLEALYEEANVANPRLHAAREQTRAAEAWALTATRPPDPRLQLGWMNRTLPGLAPMDPLGMTQLQLMQMLPTAGKLAAAARVARTQAIGTGFRAQELSWEIRAEVAAAFYTLYRVERAGMVARQTRQLMEDVATVADAMYRLGEAPQADVLKARVEVARMTEEIIALEAMRRVALARLGALLDRPLDLATPPAVLPAIPDDLPALAELEQAALGSRPMLRAGEADLAAAEARRTLAYRDLIPDLEVGVQVGQRAGAMGTERMGSLMVGASVPVFARRRQLPMRTEADAMRAMAAADLAAMRAETRAQIGVAHAEWQRARNLQTLYRSTVLPQARAAVESALASYRVGAVNLMTLLDNQAAVNRFEQELAAMEAMEGVAFAELEMLVGAVLGNRHRGISPPGGGG